MLRFCGSSRQFLADLHLLVDCCLVTRLQPQHLLVVLRGLLQLVQAGPCGGPALEGLDIGAVDGESEGAVCLRSSVLASLEQRHGPVGGQDGVAGVQGHPSAVALYGPLVVTGLQPVVASLLLGDGLHFPPLLLQLINLRIFPISLNIFINILAGGLHIELVPLGVISGLHGLGGCWCFCLFNFWLLARSYFFLDVVINLIFAALDSLPPGSGLRLLVLLRLNQLFVLGLHLLGPGVKVSQIIVQIRGIILHLLLYF